MGFGIKTHKSEAWNKLRLCSLFWFMFHWIYSGTWRGVWVDTSLLKSLASVLPHLSSCLENSSAGAMVFPRRQFQHRMGSNLAIVESFHPCKSPSHDTAMARTTCWPTHHPPTPLFMGTDFERVAPALSIPLLLILVKSGLNDQPVTIWLRSLLNPSWLCLSSILFCSLRVVR